jgi:hypothetical protein
MKSGDTFVVFGLGKVLTIAKRLKVTVGLFYFNSVRIARGVTYFQQA